MLYNRTKYERVSWYFAHLLNKDINVKETKLFSLETHFLDKFKNIREKFLVENKKMYERRACFSFLIQFFSLLATTIIIFMIFYDASMGIILIGSLMAYINSVSNTKNSFKSIFSVIFQLYQDALHASDIIAVLKLRESKKDSAKNGLKNINKISTIKLEKVSFKYKNSQNYTLKNINLLFEAGENYVFAGKNGSGKSTLIKLILGFYDSYEGKILIDDVELRDIDISSYRKCLSAVFQDFTKYQFKAEDAITISDVSQKDDEEKMQFATIAANADFINKLPNKFNQQLGNWFEGGKQLSGGEWQKLAIARAFYRSDASVVAMDEPSSASDPVSENKIYNSFQLLSRNKIGLFITHRLKNYEFHGKIVFLENGIVAEYGEQGELLKQDGGFKQMYDIQNIIYSKNI